LLTIIPASVLATMIVSPPHVSKILDCERKKSEGATHLKKCDTTPRLRAAVFTQRVNIRLVQPLQWFARIHGERRDLRVYASTRTSEETEMNETKRSRHINFRVTDDEYKLIEKAAVAAGDEPNNWSRGLVLSAAREGVLGGKPGRLIYTELAILRFLIGHGFKLLFSRSAEDAAAWTKLTTQADQRADAIVTELLSRRKQD
jgi:hypothetical protein